MNFPKWAYSAPLFLQFEWLAHIAATESVSSRTSMTLAAFVEFEAKIRTHAN
jgi:hypothetical protein